MPQCSRSFERGWRWKKLGFLCPSKWLTHIDDHIWSYMYFWCFLGYIWHTTSYNRLGHNWLKLDFKLYQLYLVSLPFSMSRPLPKWIGFSMAFPIRKFPTGRLGAQVGLPPASWGVDQQLLVHGQTLTALGCSFGQRIQAGTPGGQHWTASNLQTWLRFSDRSDYPLAI